MAPPSILTDGVQHLIVGLNLCFWSLPLPLTSVIPPAPLSTRFMLFYAVSVTGTGSGQQDVDILGGVIKLPQE